MFFSRGSAIAKIIGYNVIKHSEQFEENVHMWVFEELIDGRKLTEIINETHENVKYLPNHKLPANVVGLSEKNFFCTTKAYFMSNDLPFRLQFQMLLKQQRMLTY